MPTIYLKNTTFNKLVDSNHYHDYEKVISRGVDLALLEEKANMEELRQVPKSMPGPLPEQPEESPESTSIATPVDTVTEDPVCLKCHSPISEPSTLMYLGPGTGQPYHRTCLNMRASRGY